MERDHWDTLFDELYLRTYARLDRDVDDEEEALGAVALAGVEPGADVLDAPCGYGRHSIMLARAGYRVVGVDRSPVLLDEARRRQVKANGRSGCRPTTASCRSRTRASTRRSTSSRHLATAARRVIAGRSASSGACCGRAARSSWRRCTATALMHIYQRRGWDPLPDGGLLLEERTFDYVAGEIETTHSLVEAGGKRESLTYRFRVYTATELVRLVEEAGFTAVECFGGWEREELSRETRLILVARVP